MVNLITSENLSEKDRSRWSPHPNLLEPHLSEIEELILKNPFSGRIEYLLRNPKLIGEEVPDSEGDLQAPNCAGVCAYVVGAIDKLRFVSFDQLASINLDSVPPRDDFTIYSNSPNFNHIFIPISQRVPGTVSLRPRFGYDDSEWDFHAGVFLGSIGNLDLFFSKIRPYSFGIESGVELRNGYYLLPKDLTRVAIS